MDEHMDGWTDRRAPICILNEEGYTMIPIPPLNPMIRRCRQASYLSVFVPFHGELIRPDAFAHYDTLDHLE